MELDLEKITLPGVDEKRPLVIAGPCSAETEEQVMETARQLAARGIKIFRAGIWKPRAPASGNPAPSPEASKAWVWTDYPGSRK